MRTSDGVSLTCDKGWVWKTLKLFLLRFSADDKGFQLPRDRGCAWRTLG